MIPLILMSLRPNPAARLPLAEIVWGAPQWTVPVMIVSGLLVIAVLVNYATSHVSPGIKILAAALKLVAIVLLALCLLQPMRRGIRPRPRANLMPILVDDSRSMSLPAEKDGISRGASVKELMSDQASWLTRLTQDFDVRTYSFGDRLQGITSVDELAMKDVASSLADSVRSVAKRYQGRPIGGALVFSDGQITDLIGGEFSWAQFGFPIFPVIIGNPTDADDLNIVDVSVTQTDFESAPLTVVVSVGTNRDRSEQVVVQLRDAFSDEVLKEKEVSAGPKEGGTPVRFQFRPENSGMAYFKATVFRETDRAGFDEGTSVSELTLINNSRFVAVDRQAGPYRVLYIGGRPNWDFKFLRRALAADAEVNLVSLLRIAKEKPKFSFRDQEVSDTNPLFAGLGDNAEDAAEQYDEPVIIRLGVDDSEELSDGFPDTADELFAYHGVILDDIEPGFFSQDQLAMIRQFVTARGGGLVMMGGQEAFAGRDFDETTLGELSPVYGTRTTATDRAPAPHHFKLTREGLLQPWVRLRDNETAEDTRIGEMPTFNTLSAVDDVKPGASSLAVYVDPAGTERPAIVTQRFGKGRTAALLGGDHWRWSMRRDNPAVDDPAQAWRQLTHWLVNEVPRRVELNIETPAAASASTRISVTVRNEQYLPEDNVDVEIEIKTPDKTSLTLRANADDSKSGLYHASCLADLTGVYQITTTATNQDGSVIGTAESGWVSDPGAAEFRTLSIDRERLQLIARETGGEVIEHADLDTFVADLPNRKVPVTESWVYPIWHQPWVMLAALACLCSEWGLRRWKGLA